MHKGFSSKLSWNCKTIFNSVVIEHLTWKVMTVRENRSIRYSTIDNYSHGLTTCVSFPMWSISKLFTFQNWQKSQKRKDFCRCSRLTNYIATLHFMKTYVQFILGYTGTLLYEIRSILTMILQMAFELGFIDETTTTNAHDWLFILVDETVPFETCTA